MWNPFRNKVVYSIPDVNSVWSSREHNPFDRHEVLVLAVKEGYVQYKAEELVLRRSMSLESFHEYYSEIQGGD